MSYWDAPFNCTCNNDNGNETEFDNFWRNSGSCCDNMRLSIWIIFNIIFFVLVFLLYLKIRSEKARIQADLENFEINEVAEDDDGNSSATDSLTERINR